eukprot:733300-Alexandrium_andersonii.AAC.1
MGGESVRWTPLGRRGSTQHVCSPLYALELARGHGHEHGHRQGHAHGHALGRGRRRGHGRTLGHAQ